MQHPFFVAQDYLWRFDFQQTLQAVVADDNPTIKVVQVRAGKTTTIQWHQRAQFGWNYRQVLDNSPFRTVFHAGLSIAERFYYAQALQCFRLTLLRRFVGSLVAQVVRQLIQFQAVEHIPNRFGTHAGDEFIWIGIFQQLVFCGQRFQVFEVFFFGQEVVVAYAFVAFNPWLDYDIAFVVNN